MGLLDIFRIKSSVEVSSKCLAQYQTNLIEVKNKNRQEIISRMGINEQLIVEKSLGNNGGLYLTVKNYNYDTIGIIPKDIAIEIEKNFTDFEAQIAWYNTYNNVDGKYECCVCLKIY